MTDRFEQGQLIDGRYRVEGKLGAGGMADVYLAEDTTLGRRVAIKVLLGRFAEDRQFVERFRREAQAAAGLNHPNIVNIFDWGRVGATYYIVMEYVRGETLKQLIRRRGRLEPDEAALIALDLLSAVAFAHEHHIVHRDVKSQNILIDDKGRLRVTDFGIARAGDSSMTEAGSILGTAQYLAPEQAKGEAVDERSDLYSVGVVLYEMVTGSVPFRGDSAVTVAMKQVNEVPTPPAELVADLPPALNVIILKALAKDPGRRYQSALEFSRDLRNAAAGGPLAADTFDFAEERTQVVAPIPLAGETPTRVMPRAPAGAAAPAAAPAKKRRKRSPWPWLLLVAIIVLAAIAGFFLYRAVMGTAVEVPDVVGQTEQQAKQRLKAAGFAVKVNDTYSDAVATGEVDRQSPTGGQKLAEGETVEVWVSRGPANVSLDDFRGWSAAAVADWLKGNGLEGVRKNGSSDKYPSGTVFKQDPKAGEKVARGGAVTYWVSTGTAKVLVPDVSGLTQAQAEAAIEKAGLVVGTVTQAPSTTVAAGQVVSQTPAADSEVAKGTPVSFVVSSGSPSPSPSPSQVSVPDVLTWLVGDAKAELEGAGFVVRIKEKGGSGQPPGTVFDQDPAGDTQAPEGSTVTIWVAK